MKSLKSNFIAPIVILATLVLFAGCTDDSSTSEGIAGPSELTYKKKDGVYIVGNSIQKNEPIVNVEITSWSVAPPLPSGLTLNTTTGIISGTPNTEQSKKDYTITASNPSESLNTDISITVNRSFWSMNSSKDIENDSSSFFQVSAGLKKEGTNCIIYVQEGHNINSETINYITDEFDNKMWNIVTNNFAVPADMDGNGKVIILLMDIKDQYDPSDETVYTGGYFFAIDMYTNDELMDLGYPEHIKSNEADMIYIDIYPNDPTTKDGRSVIVHELQHLACFSRNVINESSNELPIWINEGFSTMAEAVYQDVHILSAREDWYDLDPLYTGAYDVEEDRDKSISHGFPFVIWDPYPSNSISILNNYSMSHLFFAWLRIQMNSDSFFKEINDSFDNTVQSIVDVCSAVIGSDVDTYAKMLGRWYMANLLGGNGKISGLESYKGKNTHGGPYSYISPGILIDLKASGAGHFKGEDYDNWSPSGGSSYINYAMGDLVSLTADYTAPFGTGSSDTVMIVYNIDSSENDERFSAVLPSVSYIPATMALSLSNDLSQSSMMNELREKKAPNGAFRVGLDPIGKYLKKLNNK